MPLLALILFIIAAVLFFVAAWAEPHSWRLVPLGLAVFTVAVTCQFLVHGALVS